MGQSQLLGHTAENIRRRHTTADEKHLTLMVIDCTGVALKLVGGDDGHRGLMDQRLQQEPFIHIDHRLLLGTGGGLGDIEHLLHIVGGTPGVVLPLVFLAGFQNGDAVLILLDGSTGLGPAVEVLQLRCLGHLRQDQQHIGGGVPVKPCLGVQEAAQHTAIAANGGGSGIRQRIHRLPLRLLLFAPGLLIEGLVRLCFYGRRDVKDIIKSAHTVTSLSACASFCAWAACGW